MRNVMAAVSHMVARMREMEITANNLSNANTPGFKKDMYFENILQDVVARNEPYFGGQLRLDERELVDLEQGTLDQTDNPLDLAINGKGFFVVQTDQGEVFTRNGNFRLNEFGVLINNADHKVLGMGGPIMIEPEFGPVSISKNGTIMQGDKLIDQLRMVTPMNEDDIVKMGDSGYRFQVDPNGQDQGVIMQGYLEKSNVNSIKSMTKMIALQQTFESNQRVLRTVDDIDSLAANRVGKI
jgi:flagellar basal-body rod protein FlgF